MVSSTVRHQPCIDAAGPKQSPAWRGHFRSQFNKTRLCRFYPVGTCKFGDSCAYAHAREELSDAPDLTKTSMCKAWQDGNCKKPSDKCPYAHGAAELRVTAAFASKKLSRRTRDAPHSPHDVGETSTTRSTESGSPLRSRFTGFSASTGPPSPISPGSSPGQTQVISLQPLGSDVEARTAATWSNATWSQGVASPSKGKSVLCLSDILVAEDDEVCPLAAALASPQGLWDGGGGGAAAMASPLGGKQHGGAAGGRTAAAKQAAFVQNLAGLSLESLLSPLGSSLGSLGQPPHPGHSSLAALLASGAGSLAGVSSAPAPGLAGASPPPAPGLTVASPPPGPLSPPPGIFSMPLPESPSRRAGTPAPGLLPPRTPPGKLSPKVMEAPCSPPGKLSSKTADVPCTPPGVLSSRAAEVPRMPPGTLLEVQKPRAQEPWHLQASSAASSPWRRSSALELDEGFAAEVSAARQNNDPMRIEVITTLVS